MQRSSCSAVLYSMLCLNLLNSSETAITGTTVGLPAAKFVFSLSICTYFWMSNACFLRKVIVLSHTYGILRATSKSRTHVLPSKLPLVQRTPLCGYNARTALLTEYVCREIGRTGKIITDMGEEWPENELWENQWQLLHYSPLPQWNHVLSECSSRLDWDVRGETLTLLTLFLHVVYSLSRGVGPKRSGVRSVLYVNRFSKHQFVVYNSSLQLFSLGTFILSALC
jgi:hypothetical protein